MKIMFDTSTPTPDLSVIEASLSKLSNRLIEARQSYKGNNIPSGLLTEDIVFGLTSITTESPYSTPVQRVRALRRLVVNTDQTNGRLWQQVEKLKRQALLSIRTLIGGLIQGGLPAQHAYEFFTMDDLNLLFYTHSKLTGADQYPDIPFWEFSKVDSYDY